MCVQLSVLAKDLCFVESRPIQIQHDLILSNIAVKIFANSIAFSCWAQVELQEDPVSSGAESPTNVTTPLKPSDTE